MTIRWIIAAIGLTIVLPIAVFLRPAWAAPAPQVVIVQHCGKEVMFIGINKGMFNVATPDVIESRKEVYDFFAEIMHTGNITIFKVEDRSGIKCPVTA